MLVMSKGALTAAQAETYYEEKYSHDDYYSDKQRVVGQWFGGGAEELGLSGQVATEDFRAVLHGHHPASGEVLVHNANGYDDRRAGWESALAYMDLKPGTPLDRIAIDQVFVGKLLPAWRAPALAALPPTEARS